MLTIACGPAAPPSAIPPAPAARPASIYFIEDDYPRALDEARRSGKPLFVDAWASWCHTCLSLRAFVFPDPIVTARAGEFVWLAVDTEKAENAQFLRTHPMDAWPTLWVIDPQTEAPALRWNGSATAGELASLLEDAKLTILHGDGRVTGGEAAAAYLRGNQAAARGDVTAATASYRSALAAAPPDWPRRARAVEALSAQLRATKDYGACLDLARTELPRIPAGTSAKNVAVDALLCVGALPEAEARARAPEVLAAAERVAADPAQPTLADDRSELYEEIVDLLTTLGRTEDAKRIAGDWTVLLDAEAARARTPTERAVFDAHRCEAYIALGEPSRAVPILRASERDFPDDYNAPARLATAYLAMRRYDDALAAIDRAITKAHGPRLVRLYTVKADVLAARGDAAGEARAVAEGLARTRDLVVTGSAARARAALEARGQKKP